MSGKKATHMMVLFELPGPADVEAELGDLIPFLVRDNGLKLSENCKIKSLIGQAGEATNWIPITATITTWLDEVAGGFEKFSIKQVGINVHDSSYSFFQAAWAMPLSRKEAAKTTRERAEVEAAVLATLEGKPMDKPKKKWWQFWK